jgi:hypothetical protein
VLLPVSVMPMPSIRKFVLPPPPRRPRFVVPGSPDMPGAKTARLKSDRF